MHPRHVQGICDQLAEMIKQKHGIDVDPHKNIAICCGQSEAFAAAVFATINLRDEVLLFDPAYETYGACITMAGGVPVYVPLDPPHWTLNLELFVGSFTSRTKAIVVNSPHNPTGKVFTTDELAAIAQVCCDKDCLAITDEVYEYITFDLAKHISLASFPGMAERTIITSSLSKTYSVTGWRVGWAIASTPIASAIKNIHVKLTDSAPAPFQEAALIALRSSPSFFEHLKTEYEERRDTIVKILREAGFKVHFKPQGSFFVFAELPEHCVLPDVDFVAELIKKAGVAAVPGCGFFHESRVLRKGISSDSLVSGEMPKPYQNYEKRYVRFAFCKSSATLEAAAQKLNQFVITNEHEEPH
ncbi:uncharacterized protein LOC18445130 isoform X2 [Amborella trichopoda]|uniref:uncharacterized protein LOC18445130 isoform X2 n=1 Tax=Amborella trichopoda TaxID=13333 RepID=UPI0009C0CDE4|nr:uncharacterized protein LOC18445130 isoform X2 [Amborella trichopoda]|eukprot:XP_020529712.1 uncharacterized protein LOC18445130 isoform X2 [Amborella trichopoda]